MLKIPDSLTIEYFLNDLGLGLQKGFQHSTQIVLFKQEYDFLNEGLKIEDFHTIFEHENLLHNNFFSCLSGLPPTSQKA